MTAGGRQTPILSWRPREVTREFGTLVQDILVGVGEDQEAEKDWRLSKESRSPSATNDSWTAPDSISGLETSENSEKLTQLVQDFLTAWKKNKGKK